MKALKTEAQILARWTILSPPLVSVICITYNQAPYLADAIDGFLSQETEFPFEIILHDDASTDGTADIIMRYARQYPTIIKPILQTENQLSQEINTLLAAISYAQGKYLAMCDGDDYWIDSQKLQLQIEAMQKNPTCHISCHSVLQTFLKNKKNNKVIAKHANHSKIFPTREVILGSAGFCPTASVIINKSIFDRLPKWFDEVPVGDYFLQILGALNGGAIYIDRVMSVYRVKSIGSWSARMAHDPAFAHDYFVKIIKALEYIDAYTDQKYHREFDIIKRKASFLMCRTPLLSLLQRRSFYQKHNNTFRLREKIMWHACYNNSTLCHWLYKLEQCVKN